MTALPYPTKTRLALAETIAAGKVRHYPFHVPQTYNDITGNLVTSKVQFLVHVGLVEVPEPPADYNYSVVRLTPAGEEWSGFKNRTKEGEGPGSTSPEPGPEAPTLTEIVEFLDPDGKLRAESTKDGSE